MHIGPNVFGSFYGRPRCSVSEAESHPWREAYDDDAFHEPLGLVGDGFVWSRICLGVGWKSTLFLPQKAGGLGRSKHIEEASRLAWWILAPFPALFSHSCLEAKEPGRCEGDLAI